MGKKSEVKRLNKALTFTGLVTGVYILIFYLMIPFSMPGNDVDKMFKTPVNFFNKETTKKQKLNIKERKNKHDRNHLYFSRV